MRKIYNMNFQWQFYDGDIPNPCLPKSGSCVIAQAGYTNPELTWKTVQIPHDLRHDRCEFSPDANMVQGFLTTGIAWYRKEFFFPKEEEGKGIYLEFDGVFRDSEVYVNGNFVGRHASGYTSFDYEISDFIHYGDNNVLAVRVDGKKYEGWWYEAVGIYRDVRLLVTDSVRIKHDGVYVHYQIEGDTATVDVEVELDNLGTKSGEFPISLEITSPQGEIIEKMADSVSISTYSACCQKFRFTLKNPKLWDINQPENQYKAMVTLGDLDCCSQLFGLKTLEFHPEKGIFLNGNHVKIKGVCVHDDFAGVGGAMSEAVIRHKIYLLKQWGVNGYRCSHNPPSPYVLKACDDFGILVMDEVRLMSTAEEYVKQMCDTMRRDRNHPSIFMWSIGNEEMSIHGTETGVKIMNKLRRIARTMDYSLPFVYANNQNWKNITDFHEEHGFHADVFGFNYNCSRDFSSYEYIHEKYPERMIIGTENGSAISTRGQYLPRKVELSDDYYSEKALPVLIWGNPKREKNVSAYGETYTVWGSMPMENLKASDPDYVAGYFLWTGFDYRGEIIPLQYPSVVSRFGMLDLCGFRKDLAEQYAVKWASEPKIHLYPHWSFQEDLEEVEVQIVANTEEVEFFHNDVSLGKVKNPIREVLKYFLPYHLGKEKNIRAVGYNQGKPVVEMCHNTTGKPEKIHLEVLQDRDYIANGEDNIFVKVELLDAQGQHCPTADHLMEFSVTGEGTFLGCGNGDPLSHDDDKVPQRPLFHGLALVILRSSRQLGEISLTVRSQGFPEESLVIPVTKPSTDQLIFPKDESIIAIPRALDDAEKYL